MSITKQGAKQVAKRVSQDLSKKSPTILTMIGVAGVVGTAILASRATIIAKDIIDSQEEKLEWTDYVRLTWRTYLSSILMGSATITCIIGANSINLQRAAAMQGLMSLTETAFKEYQAKVIQNIGEKKEQKVQDDIAEDKIKNNPVSDNTIFITGSGDSLCYDALSGRYFKTDLEKLRRIQNDVNHNLISDMWVSLNELYSEMGLEGIDLGESLGWTVDEMLDFVFTSKLTETGVPCLVITHRTRPTLYSL